MAREGEFLDNTVKRPFEYQDKPRPDILSPDPNSAYTGILPAVGSAITGAAKAVGRGIAGAADWVVNAPGGEASVLTEAGQKVGGLNAPPVQPTTPAPNSAQIPVTPTAQPAGINPPPLTQSDAMKQIAFSRSNESIPEGTIETQPRNAGTITTLAPQRNPYTGIIEGAGKTETVTRGGAGGISDHAKFLQDIEALVDKFGQHSSITGGKVLPDEIVKAYTARIGMEGHKVAADAAMDYRKSSLEERERHNNLLEKDFQLKLAQQKDTTDIKHAENLVNQHSVFQASLTNPGEKERNMPLTYLNMYLSGTKPPGLAGNIDTMGKKWETYKSQLIDPKTKKPAGKLSPAEEQRALTSFKKLYTAFPEPVEK